MEDDDSIIIELVVCVCPIFFRFRRRMSLPPGIVSKALGIEFFFLFASLTRNANTLFLFLLVVLIVRILEMSGWRKTKLCRDVVGFKGKA